MEECGLTTRIDKCKFAKERIVFFGYDLSADGIILTEEKEALRSVKKSTTVRELQSFLGLAGWVLRRFVPGYSTLTEPVSALTKKGVRWNWAEPQEKAYMAVMALLDEQLDLYHFDPTLETKMYSDASPVGLGAMLCQIDKSGKERTIMFVSRTLSRIERKYSQREREALVLMWACERLHMYIYGVTFILVTNHKPLLWSYGNSRKTPPARVLRWAVRLPGYDYKVQYIQGKRNPLLPIRGMTK